MGEPSKLCAGDMDGILKFKSITRIKPLNSASALVRFNNGPFRSSKKLEGAHIKVQERDKDPSKYS